MASSAITGTRKWYPVCTLPRAEKKAHEALLQKGIQAYLPLIRQQKQWSDRKKWINEPLIKSYLFVFIGEQEQADVLMTKGIARFIYFSNKIATIPGRQIDDMKLLLAGSFELEITHEDVQPGEKVVIKAGPLKGLIGEMIAYRSQKQLVVRLESMGCSIIVNMAATLINKL